MRKLSLWMRAHPVFGDTVIAGILALLDFGTVGQRIGTGPAIAVLVGLLMVVPVVFRRKRPLLTAYLILVGGAAQLVTQGTGISSAAPLVRGADFALGVALYTLVAYVGRRHAVEYACFLLGGTALWSVWRVGDLRTGLELGLGALLVFGFCWTLGEFVGARRAYHAEVERRLKLLETERDQQGRIAVSEERTRIARELHDVVAHAVSVIVVQADGAAYAIRDDPELAETAVNTISATGREALVELRRLLDVLRSDREDRQNLTPQPSVSALPELAEKVGSVGLPVRLDLRGQLDDLPAAVGLGVYRIVQESLTNTLKHAGAGAAATVRVQRVGGLIEVEVRDDGHGTPGQLFAVSGGNGLIGMRERASVLGGTLAAGPVPAGGWRVRGTFPVRQALG